MKGDSPSLIRITDLAPAAHPHGQAQGRTVQVRIPLRTLFFPAPLYCGMVAGLNDPVRYVLAAAPVLHFCHAYRNNRE